MKHRLKIPFHSVEDDENNLHVLVDVNYIDIMKSVMRVRDKKYNQITLTITTDMPKGTVSKVTDKKITKVERMLLKLNGEQSESWPRTKRVQLFQRFNHAFSSILITLQSNSLNNHYNASIATVSATDAMQKKLYYISKKPIRSVMKSVGCGIANDFVKLFRQVNVGTVVFDDYAKIGVKRNIMKWKSNDFLIYMAHKFNETYGIKSLEYAQKAKGMIMSRIKNGLIEVFYRNGCSNNDILKYVDWIYETKAQKVDFPITFNFLKSVGLMTEYLTKTLGKKKSKQTKRQLLKRG